MISTENFKVMSFKIEELFTAHYGHAPEVIIKSPGRINIIGEHTDYNDGFVLPAAIDHNMYIGVAKRDDQKVVVHSINYEQTEEVDLTDVARTSNDWLNLIVGVVSQMKSKISGFDLAFGGNIPEGAGLSSSAALCCGVASAISELFKLKLEKWDIIKIAQRSEHDYALVECGIMDQFACMFGLTNHVLLLDCKSLTFQESEFDLGGYKFILLNSNVKHNLVESDYNVRKRESADALKVLKSMRPRVESFQEVQLKMLEELKVKMPTKLWKRAYHIVSENQRVLNVNVELKTGNYEHVGRLLTEGHASLKDYYEVTCLESDFLVDELNKSPIVLGARQVGGGFGGCILALVKDMDVDYVIEQVSASYKKAFSIKLDNIPIKIARGCHRIK